MLPLVRFRIRDESMEPAFREGDYVLVNKLAYFLSKPKVNDAVIARHGGIFIVKRIEKITANKYMLQGDNKTRSSRMAVSRKDIIGKVMLRISAGGRANRND